MEPTILILIAVVVLIVIVAYVSRRRAVLPAQPSTTAEAGSAAVPPELAKPYSNPSGFEDNLADALEKEYRWDQADRVDDPTWYRKGVETLEFKQAADETNQILKDAGLSNDKNSKSDKA